MLEIFYPDERWDSPYSIDLDRYFRAGYRGIIFDIDNTLVPHGFPADGKAVDYFNKLHSYPFSTCLLSNNKEPRVRPFAEAVSSDFISKAGKPSRRGYEEAMKKMGTDASTTLFIGDQLFTDVWGAKRAGIHSILVKPIDPHEEIQIVLKRYLEKIVLYRMEQQERKQKLK